MIEQEYTLEEISYSLKEDSRIMESVLSGWFNNPKTLNFVSPSLSYPFQFKKWIAVSYASHMDQTTTTVLKHRDWIIGHLSMRLEGTNAHIFHLFIDPVYRNKGLATKMIHEMERHGHELGAHHFTLNVVKKNKAAISLYQKLGYEKYGQSSTKYIKMNKTLETD